MRLSVFGDGKRQPGPADQGTRASLAQGTGQPKDVPAPAQEGGTEMVPNTQSTVVQNAGYPADGWRDATPASGTREFVARTDMSMQTQPAPHRITRQFQDRNMGTIGPDMVASFPYNAEWGFIPHQYVPRQPRGAGPARRQVDDTAPVTAVYAGNPRPTR